MAQQHDLIPNLLVGKWTFLSYTHMFFDLNGAETSATIKAKSNSTISIQKIIIQDDTDEVEGIDFTYTVSNKIPFSGVIGTGINTENLTVNIDDKENLIVSSLEEGKPLLKLIPNFPEDIIEINHLISEQFEKFKRQGFTHILSFGDPFNSQFLVSAKKQSNNLSTYNCNSNQFLLKIIDKTHIALLKTEAIAMKRFDCGLHNQGKKSTAINENGKIHSKSSVLTMSK